eukprot:TRINITY_DN2254_c0_g2_i1.p1 TRINITY_DN2254_c0_g2~~TRINITY_DN2254_c0_g2_i1.p1  ORF type:complete len:406 (+),score=64.53 TRINITY_DN2254_c0_g2_i1:103-1218(+)
MALYAGYADFIVLHLDLLVAHLDQLILVLDLVKKNINVIVSNFDSVAPCLEELLSTERLELVIRHQNALDEDVIRYLAKDIFYIVYYFDKFKPYLPALEQYIVDSKADGKELDLLSRFGEIRPFLPGLLEYKENDKILQAIPILLDDGKLLRMLDVGLESLIPTVEFLVPHLEEVLLPNMNMIFESEGNFEKIFLCQKCSDGECDGDNHVTVMEQLLPYVDYFVEHLETIWPYFGQILPHLELLLFYYPKLHRHVDVLVARIDEIMPHIDVVIPNMPYLVPYLEYLLPHLEEVLPHTSKLVNNFGSFLPHIHKFIPSTAPYLPFLMKIYPLAFGKQQKGGPQFPPLPDQATASPERANTLDESSLYNSRSF